MLPKRNNAVGFRHNACAGRYFALQLIRPIGASRQSARLEPNRFDQSERVGFEVHSTGRAYPPPARGRDWLSVTSRLGARIAIASRFDASASAVALVDRDDPAGRADCEVDADHNDQARRREAWKRDSGPLCFDRTTSVVFVREFEPRSGFPRRTWYILKCDSEALPTERRPSPGCDGSLGRGVERPPRRAV